MEKTLWPKNMAHIHGMSITYYSSPGITLQTAIRQFRLGIPACTKLTCFFSESLSTSYSTWCKAGSQ